MKTNEPCAKIQEALSAFQFSGNIVSRGRYGNGHINDTFLVMTNDNGVQKRYILQRINHSIFKKPEELMENISGVTRYLRQKISEQNGDPQRETLNLVTAENGSDYFSDSDGNYWRCYDFIENTTCFEKVEKPEAFYESGRSFGQFQNLLAGYPAASLHETIPNFHNTPLRYEALTAAISADVCGRADEAAAELTFIRERQEELALAVNMQKEGILPLRVTHNDTKLNNILFDNVTGKGICVIDLDTIMPGLSINDFGDAIRFGANTALEDETDLNKVALSLPLFETYTRGFLAGAGGRLTADEIKMLPMGAKLMTMECGIRFLTDYLQGDVYFKIHRPNHNLDRARNQLRLVKDMEDKWKQMIAIIDKYYAEKSTVY